MRTVKETTSYNQALSAVRSLNTAERRKLISELNRQQMLDALSQMPSYDEEIKMEEIVKEVKLYRKERNAKADRS